MPKPRSVNSKINSISYLLSFSKSNRHGHGSSFDPTLNSLSSNGSHLKVYDIERKHTTNFWHSKVGHPFNIGPEYS